jgi:cell division septum initiation protein DivIVA
MLQHNLNNELSADGNLQHPMKNKNVPPSAAKSQPPKNIAKSAPRSTTSYPDYIEPEVKPETKTSDMREPQVVRFLMELSRLEELLLTSSRVPLTGKVIVAEDDIIEHLDIIRSRVPATIDAAQSIVSQQNLILLAAEQQAQQQITAAQQHAFQISNELGIIDRAKLEAAQIRQTVMAECATAREQVSQEIEQARHQQLQEINNIRQQALAEAQAIRRGADDYADQVLQAIDTQLGEIQAKIRRGRQHLNSNVGS